MSNQIWYATVPRSTRKHIIAGFAITVFSVLGFAAWSATAPIAGAIITSGAFVASGQNKTIQHLEGGVINEILVREGDIVEAGQTLVILDETTPRAELRRLTLKQSRLEAIEARLKAEMDGADDIDMPRHLEIERDTDVATIVENQRLTFKARRNALKSEIASIEDGISSLQEHIAGARVQLTSVKDQLSLYEEEIAGKKGLLTNGLIRKSEVLQLQRARFGLQGEVGRLTGDIGDSRERISRAREQIAGVRNTAARQAVEQLQEVRGELFDTRERIMASRGVLDRIRISTPVRGVVVKLRYHSPGGVIEPGRSIMEVLPLKDELLIEARVRPQDIDSVKRGNLAMIRLTALNQRTTPMVTGEVIYVSADAFSEEGRTDKASNDTYIARIRLSNEEVATIPHFTPTPGMPAEVYIRTADRTFFEYLTKPVRDTMSRAFREP
jgi:HlyD family type I secretion membrane fusion protein